MYTIALRFGEQFSPPCGTIAAHQRIIDELGYVWYGKLGGVVSQAIVKSILQSNDPRILLINSGKIDRYWAHVVDFSTTRPPEIEYPVYYQSKADRMKCWFKISAFERADNDVMAHCFVCSSKRVLSEVSRSSMSPYFIIEYRP